MNPIIRLQIVDNKYLVHSIDRCVFNIIFNDDILKVINYGNFIIDKVYKYNKHSNEKDKYIIFKSDNQFIHIKYSDVNFDRLYIDSKEYEIKYNSYQIIYVDSAKSDVYLSEKIRKILKSDTSKNHPHTKNK